GALIMKDKFWMWNPFGWVICNTKGDCLDDISNLTPLHGKNYAVKLGRCNYPIKFNGNGNCEVDDVGHYPIDIFGQIVDKAIAPLQENLKELTETPRTRENLRQYGEKIEKQAERVVGALKEMEEALRKRGL
ncbi:MAG: hypothetical protein LUD72_12150, partial [Bacteroidales bacterium]|nr:hypothetical protein [Bacteroidales bacterium]